MALKIGSVVEEQYWFENTKIYTYSRPTHKHASSVATVIIMLDHRVCGLTFFFFFFFKYRNNHTYFSKPRVLKI